MNHPKIKFTIKNHGEMIAELYPEKAPVTVKNFLDLVESGYNTRYCIKEICHEDYPA